MDNFQFLDDARRCYRRGDLAGAREALDRCLQHGHKTADVFKYIGLISIFEANFEKARENLFRSLRLSPSDPEALNGLAFLDLKQGRTDQAIDHWLKALDKDPRHALSRRNLARLRGTSETEAFIDSASARTFLRGGVFVLPDLGPILDNRIVRISATAALVLLLAALAVWILRPDTGRPSGRPELKTPAKSLATVRLPKSDDFVRSDSASLYTFLQAEIPALFNDCKRSIRRRDYNQVVVTVNKVLHSNASEEVKQRFLFLKEFLPEPRDWRDIKTRIPFIELFNLPTVYEGAYLVVDGPLGGLQTRENRTSFTVRAKDRPEGDVFICMVRMEGRYDKLANGVSCRVLARFENIVPLKGTVIVEGLKAWVEQKEFYEASTPAADGW